MSIRKDTPNPLVSAGEIVLYQPEGEVKLEVRVENETVWLTQAQMAELFQEKSISYCQTHSKRYFRRRNHQRR